MSNPTNPSAFPYAVPYDFHSVCAGMTLRDWFAGQALIGILASKTGIGIGVWEATAEYAYRHADAMLERREDPREDPE